MEWSYSHGSALTTIKVRSLMKKSKVMVKAYEQDMEARRLWGCPKKKKGLLHRAVRKRKLRKSSDRLWLDPADFESKLLQLVCSKCWSETTPKMSHLAAVFFILYSHSSQLETTS